MALHDGRHLLQINHYINDSLTGAAKSGRSDYGNPIKDMKNLLQAH